MGLHSTLSYFKSGNASEILGGTVGGMLQVWVGHPFDTIKVRMQSDPEFRSVKQSIALTLRNEGLRGFYKGVTPPFVMTGILNGVMFSVNGAMKRIISRVTGVDKTRLGTFHIIVSAWMTAPVYAFVLTPTDFVKSRLQRQKNGGVKMYSGPIDCIRQTLRSKGVLGLFRGYTMTTVTRLIGSPFYFAGYQIVRKSFIPEGGTVQDLQKWQIAASGGCAGTLFWAVNFPVDCIKTNVQTNTTNATIPEIVRGMYTNGGFRAFYRGFVPCIMRAFPANAASFFGLEMTLKFLGAEEF